MSIIYVIKNNINKKCYIGQTVMKINRRLNCHIQSKSIIGKALKKYGKENFKLFIFHIPEELLDYFEVQMIKKICTISPKGYNLETGGHLLKHHHTETKNKISLANKGNHYKKGYKLTLIQKSNLSNAAKGNKNCLGRVLSQSTKDRIGKGNKGLLCGDKNPSKKLDARRKISQKLKGNKWNVGKLHSKETIKKQSDSVKKWWEKRKQEEKKCVFA